MKRIVLAYSGGFVTSAAIPWLIQRYGAEVVAVTLDVGQGRELAALRERALAAGAVRAHVIDVREEFVRDFVRPALQAGVFGETDASLVSALARPLVARRLVDMARMESAAAVAHGGEPGMSLEVALHTSIQSLEPALHVIAPAREWRMSAPELAAFARAHSIPVPPAEQCWTDANVWGRVLGVDAGDIPESAFTLTRMAEEAPAAAASVEIEFAAGVAVRANGVEMQPLEMIESLETIAGAHGVGRSRMTDTVSGASSAVESPAAVVLHTAQQALEQAVLGRDVAALKQRLAAVYARLIVSGRWFSDVREGIDVFIRLLQPRVTGVVRVTLLKGECAVTDIRASDDVRSKERSTHPKAVA